MIAFAALLLEVSYTRIFSYKLVYFFAYVVVGLALLGLGSGGVLVSLLRPDRRIGRDRLLTGLAVIAPISVLLGYLVVALVPVNAFDMIRGGAGAPLLVEGSKLLLVSTALFVPFLCAGVAGTAPPRAARRRDGLRPGGAGPAARAPARPVAPDSAPGGGAHLSSRRSGSASCSSS